jgi:hypothetical protein
MNGRASVDWTVWNRRTLTVFGPILILTGIAGFLIPQRFALMSGAPAYNVFHISFGVIGTGLVVAQSAPGIVLFNLGFGFADLYQAAAGAAGWFPAALFQYRPADHVAHVVVGVALAAIGWQCRRVLR